MNLSSRGSTLRRCLALLTLVLSAGLSGYGYSQDIQGRGATFPAKLYQAMFDEYQTLTSYVVGYDAEGSGAGIRAILAQSVDFGASDRFLTDTQLASAVASPYTNTPNVIFHLPTALSAVVAAYNFAPFAQLSELTLDGETLAKIFLGEIRHWQHPDIIATNPGLSLPDMPITVVHRADGSGTTSIFTDYLSKVSEDWARQIGAGGRTFLDWSVGIPGEGNSGVAEAVRRTPGAIGYVVLSTAIDSKLPMAQLINQAGNAVSPSLESISLASEVDLPADLRISLTNTSNPQGWPIVGFTYLLIYQDQNYAGRSLEQAERVKGLARWMLTDGQALNNGLNYARISEAAQLQALSLLDKIFFSQ